MKSQSTPATAHRMPIASSQSCVYRHACFHDPVTHNPASGTIANWLGMHNYSWYNTAALIVLERAGFTGADVPLDHMINERDTATLASDADKALNPQFDLERMA